MLKVNYSIKTILLILLGILLFSADVFAYTISGKVTNYIIAESIKDAYVYVYGADKYAYTDSNGNYTITNIPAGTYALNVYKTGAAYEPYQEDHFNISSDIPNKDISLLPYVTITSFSVSSSYVNPGGTINITYNLHNSSSNDQAVWLGASVKTPAQSWSESYSDPDHDVQVTVHAGDSTFSRAFVMPSTQGIYDVLVKIWKDKISGLMYDCYDGSEKKTLVEVINVGAPQTLPEFKGLILFFDRQKALNDINNLDLSTPNTLNTDFGNYVGRQSKNFAPGGILFARFTVKNWDSYKDYPFKIKADIIKKDGSFIKPVERYPAGDWSLDKYFYWIDKTDLRDYFLPVRLDDLLAGEYKLKLTLVIWTGTEELEVSTLENGDFTIIADSNKPPVILVHGIGGDPDGFADLEELLEGEGLAVESIFYTSKTDDGADNTPQKNIKNCAFELAQFISCYKKVDIIAHSLGGLVTNAYFSSLAKDRYSESTFPYPDNSDENGHIRRYVILETPNFGVPGETIGEYLLHEGLSDYHWGSGLINDAKAGSSLLWELYYHYAQLCKEVQCLTVAGTETEIAGIEFVTPSTVSLQQYGVPMRYVRTSHAQICKVNKEVYENGETKYPYIDSHYKDYYVYNYIKSFLNSASVPLGNQSGAEARLVPTGQIIFRGVPPQQNPPIQAQGSRLVNLSKYDYGNTFFGIYPDWAYNSVTGTEVFRDLRLRVCAGQGCSLQETAQEELSNIIVNLGNEAFPNYPEVPLGEDYTINVPYYRTTVVQTPLSMPDRSFLINITYPSLNGVYNTNNIGEIRGVAREGYSGIDNSSWEYQLYKIGETGQWIRFVLETLPSAANAWTWADTDEIKAKIREKGDGTYKLGVRVNNNAGNATNAAWVEEFTVSSTAPPNNPPNTPSNITPSNGATGISLTPTLQSSVFSDSDSGDNHRASQWQIRSSSGTYSNPIYDSGIDTVNKESIPVPSGKLNYSSTYYWRIKHQDNHEDWSEWSNETNFITRAEPNTIRLISPNGGESIAARRIYNITWTSTGSQIDHIELFYSTDSGNYPYQTITQSAANNGSFSWRVPDINCTTTRLIANAKDSDNNTLSVDASDGDFTITPSLTVSVNGIYPSSGLNTGLRDVIIYGVNFQSGATVKLIKNGLPDITASNVNVTCSNKLTCTLDLTGAQVGVRDVKVVNPNNQCGFLKSGFTINTPVSLPIGWNTTNLGLTGGNIAIGDGDNDGGLEIYMANSFTTYTYQIKFDGGSWIKKDVGLSKGIFANVVAVGDGSNDEKFEVYGEAYSKGIFQYRWDGSSWFTSDTGEGRMGFGGSHFWNVVIGDGDNDGSLEVYGANWDGHIHKFKWNELIRGWEGPVDVGSGINEMWDVAIGDGDNDGKLEVYGANRDGHIYQFKWNAVSWVKTDLGAGGGWMNAVAVGDGDNDGKIEVYGADNDSNVYQFKLEGSTWTKESLGLGASSIWGIAIGDGDNDGNQEVYATDSGKNLYRFKCHDGIWGKDIIEITQVSLSISRLAIGDVDNDGLLEIYIGDFSDNIYQVKAITIQNDPPSTPGNVSPSNETTGISLTPTLQSSGFSDSDSGDTHQASQWQISSTSGNYSSPIWDSGTDTVNKTSAPVPSGRLNNSTTYYWRVRYQDNHGAWSEWSTETRFTTLAAVSTVSITVTTSIGTGTTVKVDGTNRNAPYNTTWDSGSSHTLDIDSPQNGLFSTQRYIYSSWSDAGSQNHQVAPTVNTTYTATLLTQWKPTVLLLGTDSSHTVNVTYTQKGVVLRDFGIKSSWSDWCDAGSTLTFSQTTTGTPPKVTIDTCSWTVNSAFSNNIQYVTSDFEFNPVPSPGSRTIVQGGSTDYTVSLKSLGGYNAPVYLSVSNIQPWPGSGDPITWSFSQSPVTPQDPSATATLNITTSQSVIPQTYTLTIQGQDGAYIKNTSVALTVNSSPLNGSVSGRIFKQEAVQVVLPNAYVRAVEEFAPWSERAFDYSDPQGVYNLIGLTPGLYTVYAKCENYGTAIKLHVPVNAGQDTPNQDLYVSIDPGRISGSVKNSSQQALGNVRVQLSVAEADGHNYYTGTYDDTLQTGNYELLDLSPRNDYQIRLGGITVNSVDYAGETRSNISVQSGQYKTENFILQPAAKIFGWVKDSQGNLIKDTRIETWVENNNVYNAQDTTTDSNGNYKDYSLRYLPPGYIFTVEATPPESSNYAMQRFEVNVPSPGDYERNITLLSNAIKISGKVTDKTTHQAIANIRVTYWNTEKKVWKEALTDKDGNYRFTNLPPGEGRVTVKPTSSYACDAVKKNFQSDDTVDFALCPEATLTGVVKDFYTKQTILKSIKIDYWNGQDQSISMQTYTEPANGTFTLGGIPKGIAELTITPDVNTGYAWTVNYLYFTEGEHKSDVAFYLKKGALISGSVKGPDNSPKAGVEIGVNGPLAPGIPEDWRGDSDINGEFKLRLAPGSPVTYGVGVAGWEGVNWVGLPQEVTVNNYTDDQPVNLTAYDSTNAGHISGEIIGNYPKTSEFQVGAFLAGTVLDKNTIKLLRPLNSDRLQNPGSYELMVPPGNNYDLYLLVYDSGDGGIANSITLRDKFPTPVSAGSTGKNLYYNSVGGTVTGQVTYQGQPVLMSTVYLEDSSGNLAGFADTNQNGVYRLYNVPEGDYVVSAWYPDYGTNQDFSANGVTDNGTITANIIIGDTANHPPVLYPIGDKTVNRREVLSFTLKAVDPDGDKIRYEISGAPQGASCNAQSGSFLWRPEIWQAGEFPVTFIARDTQGNQDSESITISVPNAAPVLYPIGNKTVKAGRYLILKLGATDSDPVDQGKLKYYAENLPRGASFNSATGTFQWRPQRGTYQVRFSVSDPPGATDTEAITITVQ